MDLDFYFLNSQFHKFFIQNAWKITKNPINILNIMIISFLKIIILSQLMIQHTIQKLF